MQIKQFVAKFWLSLCLILMPWMANAAVNSNDPVALLQYIANNMIEQLKVNQANLKNKPDVVFKLAYKYVVPYADLEDMSRRVVPPQTWNQASAADRARFQKEFTNLVIRTYASALSSYKDQTVKIFPVRGNLAQLTNVEVASEINSPDAQPIRVTYRLLKRGNSWKLYDMSVEGVSLIESFRSQFADIIAKGNLTDLIAKMQQHNAR